MACAVIESYSSPTGDPAQWQDADIVGGILAGDERCFDVLHARYRRLGGLIRPCRTEHAEVACSVRHARLACPTTCSPIGLSLAGRRPEAPPTLRTVPGSTSTVNGQSCRGG